MLKFTITGIELITRPVHFRRLSCMIFALQQRNCTSSSHTQMKSSISLGRPITPLSSLLLQVTEESISGTYHLLDRSRLPMTRKTDHRNCYLFMEVCHHLSREPDNLHPPTHRTHRSSYRLLLGTRRIRKLDCSQRVRRQRRHGMATNHAGVGWRRSENR